jgi:hypothetical protein
VRIAAAAIAALLLLPVGRALADADPPSDVLLQQDVYYPYFPAASGPSVKQLDGLVATAKRRGFPLKVALVATRSDLGAVPDLFGKPQPYADFLDREISFNRTEPLLVVMAAGYGVAGLPAKAKAAVDGLPDPAPSGDDLARAAVVAIPKLAAAKGVSVPAPKPVAVAKQAEPHHKSGSTPIFAIPVGILVLAGLAGALRSRRLRGDA